PTLSLAYEHELLSQRSLLERTEQKFERSVVQSLLALALVGSTMLESLRQRYSRVHSQKLFG
ncbi:hypothetical protein OFN64_42355, partial [Escherichia coli]|nr:hypothetical protein [Escherichia coli]